MSYWREAARGGAAILFIGMALSIARAENAPLDPRATEAQHLREKALCHRGDVRRGCPTVAVAAVIARPAIAGGVTGELLDTTFKECAAVAVSLTAPGLAWEQRDGGSRQQVPG